MIVSWGEILWDRFPDGARLGGAPANVAYHLAVRGQSVALISRVGADLDGDRAIELLAGAGVDVSAIQRDRRRATGEVGVELDPASGDARYTLHPDRAWEAIEVDDRAAAVLSTARALCFGSLAQRTERGHAAHLAAIDRLPAGAPVVLDVNLRRGFSDWDRLATSIERATVIKLNDIEAEQLAGQYDVADPIAWMFEGGAELVALTRGPRGCRLLASSGDEADHPGFAAAPGGDNVGCGDAFVAALVDGLLAGRGLAAIAEDANRYASRVAAMRGATPLA